MSNRERTGKWPTKTSGPIPEAPGESWNAVTAALREGLRGLPGGSSLALLLAEKRGVRQRLDPTEPHHPASPGLAGRFPRAVGLLAQFEVGPDPRSSRRNVACDQLALRARIAGIGRGAFVSQVDGGGAGCTEPRQPPPVVPQKASLLGPSPTISERESGPRKILAPSLTALGKRGVPWTRLYGPAAEGCRGQSSFPGFWTLVGSSKIPGPFHGPRRKIAVGRRPFPTHGPMAGGNLGAGPGRFRRAVGLDPVALRRGLRGLPGGLLPNPIAGSETGGTTPLEPAAVHRAAGLEMGRASLPAYRPLAPIQQRRDQRRPWRNLVQGGFGLSARQTRTTRRTDSGEVSGGATEREANNHPGSAHGSHWPA